MDETRCVNSLDPVTTQDIFQYKIYLYNIICARYIYAHICCTPATKNETPCRTRESGRDECAPACGRDRAPSRMREPRHQRNVTIHLITLAGRGTATTTSRRPTAAVTGGGGAATARGWRTAAAAAARGGRPASTPPGRRRAPVPAWGAASVAVYII